jgi:hypothetical protein
VVYQGKKQLCQEEDSATKNDEHPNMAGFDLARNHADKRRFIAGIEDS